MCCSVLKCVAVRGSLWHCAVLCCSVLQCGADSMDNLSFRNILHQSAVHCKTLLHTATYRERHRSTTPSSTRCNKRQHTTTHCNTLQDTREGMRSTVPPSTHCNTLHRTASYCNILQHTATCCDTHPNTKRNIGVTYFLQHNATPYNTLHHTAKPATQLQHTVTQIKIPERTYQYRASFKHYNKRQHTATQQQCSATYIKMPGGT